MINCYRLLKKELRQPKCLLDTCILVSQIFPVVRYEVIFARIEQDDRMMEPAESSDPKP